MSTDKFGDVIGQNPQERLRLAAKEYQDAFWAANTPAGGLNFSLRALMDVSNVHRLIHSGKICNGPHQQDQPIDAPPPCDLATLERDEKERVMQALGFLIEQGWAITATIERSLP